MQEWYLGWEKVSCLERCPQFRGVLIEGFNSICTHAGLAMSQIELEKIADHFDRDRDGYIDLSEISSILRGLRRARSLAKKQPISDTEKIEHEVS